MKPTKNTHEAILSLLVLGLVVISVRGAAARSPQNKLGETDGVARQLLEKFADGDKKGVIVMDFQPAFGESNTFGPWLADQLAASLASQGQTVEIVDRARLGAALQSQRLAPKDEWDMKSAVALAKSIGANALILSSYGYAENGIGVSLAAFRVSEYGAGPSARFMAGMVFAKLPLTKEVSTHLSVPLESLKPKDGVYRSGYGGVKLFDYDRHIVLLWKSDSKLFAVTDYVSSENSRCSILSVDEKVAPIEVLDVLSRQLSEGTWKQLEIHLSNHHAYVEAEVWDGPTSLKVKISGYGDADPSGFAGFYEVLLPAGKP